jgi:hypothetical protein
MDNTTAVLVAAGIGVVGRVGGTALLIRHQRRIARIERRQVAYVDAIANIHQILDLVSLLTFGPGSRVRKEAIAKRSPRDNARASIAVLGSKQVRALHESEHLQDPELGHGRSAAPALRDLTQRVPRTTRAHMITYAADLSNADVHG